MTNSTIIATSANHGGPLAHPKSLKCVLTGVPCSGKSTVADEHLTPLGHKVVTEFARQIIDEKVLHPRTDLHGFNVENFARQTKAEKEVEDHDLVFFDRGLYDPEAYFKVGNLDVPQYLQDLPNNLYHIAFIFEGLDKWKDDGTRHEDSIFAEIIRPFFPRAYAEHGVITIPVPLFSKVKEESVKARGEFIIKVVKALYPAVKLPSGN